MKFYQAVGRAVGCNVDVGERFDGDDAAMSGRLMGIAAKSIALAGDEDIAVITAAGRNGTNFWCNVQRCTPIESIDFYEDQE